MSYREAREFLAGHTDLVELHGGGARVAVAPQWQGRVMTSACGGDDGPSFGFVNRAFIEAARSDPKFNNYGGEERLWLSPEGGQFSLWFKPGAPQTMEHWYTPPAINAGAWNIVDRNDSLCRMATSMRCENASATRFELDVARDVRLLGPEDLAAIFGEKAAAQLAAPGAEVVAYETVNRITNTGSAMTKAGGLVSIWILGMLNAGPQRVTIVPYKPGDEAKLGPVVKSDYFGPIPPERLKIAPEAVLFKADGRYRSKIGTSQRRARNVLGSIDFQLGALTLAQFTMPDDPAAELYMNNAWELPQPEPYVGDVANAYNDGPNETGQQLGAFCEIESLSPARPLAAGESLVHRHRTIHVRAEPPLLAALAREVLCVELESVREAMV
jgi:hypothetical protein